MIQDYVSILILKNYTRQILSDDIIPAEFYSIIYIESGELNIQIYDLNNSFTSSILLIIPEKVRFRLYPSKFDLKIYLIGVSYKYLFNSTLIKNFNIVLFRAPYISVPIIKDDIAVLKRIFKIMLIQHQSKDTQTNEDIILFGMNFILQKLLNQDLYETKNYNTKEMVVLKFFRLLNIHYKHQHSVRFFANTLNITSDYLNKILRDILGKPTKQIINEVLVSEAKLLLSNNNLAVSEIASHLGFSSVSSFSKFFKIHTHVSPISYRLKKK